MAPKTMYAKAEGDVHVAYQVIGDGPIDVVVAFGFISHLDLMWESPSYARFIERLASFARVILFDKRGVGLSDPVADVPTLETRVDDLRAVMDAAGSERAVIFGISEGSSMAILFAATYPDRVPSLVLYGAIPRATAADDYPWAPPLEAVLEALMWTAPHWGEGITVDAFAPSAEDIPGERDFMAKLERSAASPKMVQGLYGVFLGIDVRDVLPSLHVPTLVLHRRADRVVNIGAARELAAAIDGARFVELDGVDHIPWYGDTGPLLDEIEEFVTGARGGGEVDRLLLTVMFTDIVGSTERAAELGDRRWHDLLDAHNAVVRRALAGHRGTEIKTLGDGFLATFEGPARAIRSAVEIARASAAIGAPVRVGLHCGECQKMGADVAGLTVHIAARVGALAVADEVLVTRTMKDLVAGSGIEFGDRGTHRLKGIPDEWQLYAVTKA